MPYFTDLRPRVPLPIHQGGNGPTFPANQHGECVLSCKALADTRRRITTKIRSLRDLDMTLDAGGEGYWQLRQTGAFLETCKAAETAVRLAMEDAEAALTESLSVLSGDLPPDRVANPAHPFTAAVLRFIQHADLAAVDDATRAEIGERRGAIVDALEHALANTRAALAAHGDAMQPGGPVPRAFEIVNLVFRSKGDAAVRFQCQLPDAEADRQLEAVNKRLSDVMKRKETP